MLYTYSSVCHLSIYEVRVFSVVPFPDKVDYEPMNLVEKCSGWCQSVMTC
jgi:hypothetical protein